MYMNAETIVKMIERATALEERAKKVCKDLEKIRDKIYDIIPRLDMYSAIERDSLEDVKWSSYDIDNCMGNVIHAMKRISELATLGKCDRYMVVRIKMATCEICAAEKQIEVLKEMLKMK